MHLDPLAENFVVAKPIDQKDYKQAVLADLQRRGALIGTRKRDGHKVIVEVCADKRVRLYSSGMHEIDHRLNYIREEVRTLRLPVGTLLIGELAIERITDGNVVDDVTAITSILGGSFHKAQQILARGTLPSLFVFQALHLQPQGLTWLSWEYRKTLRWLQQLLWEGHYVVAVDEVMGPLSAMQEKVSSNGWEGLVLYDADYRLTYRHGETAQRPKGCYKLKPIIEDDFFIRPDGRRFREDGVLKDVMLLQWASHEKRRILNCGRLGAFDARMRQALSSMADPKVLQVRFVSRYPKSGKLRESAFMRLRDDKYPNECIASRVWPEAQYVQ